MSCTVTPTTGWPARSCTRPLTYPAWRKLDDKVFERLIGCYSHWPARDSHHPLTVFGSSEPWLLATCRVYEPGSTSFSENLPWLSALTAGMGGVRSGSGALQLESPAQPQRLAAELLELRATLLEPFALE